LIVWLWGLASVALFAAAGLGATHVLDREARGPLLLAESVLVGGGIVAGSMAIHWSLLLPFVVWSATALAPLRFRPTRSGAVAAALQAGAFAWHAIFATQAGLYDWSEWLISRRDYFFIWGYKARLIFETHGIPWSFLGALPNDFSHRDYPLLVPLQFAVPSILARSWQPQAIGIIDTALAGAAITIAYYCLRKATSPWLAAVGSLAIAGCALLPWPGFADGPFVAYAASAALLLRARRAVPLAAVLLSLAAMTKNEGIAFAAATAITLLSLDRRRLQVMLMPGLVILLWLTIRWNLPTDLFAPGLVARVAHNLPLFPKAFANIGTSQPAVWIATLAALLLAIRENIRRERFLLTLVALQLAFYLGAYAVTPLDLVGHVNGSWDRISSHVTMLVAFAGITFIGNATRRPTPE
jgi:hypothetical protein